MADSDPRLDLYHRVRHNLAEAQAPSDTRRWWEKQRFIIPVVVAILALPIWHVAGLMVDNASSGERTPRDRLGMSKSGGGIETETGIDTAQDAEDAAAAVCVRVLALRDDLTSQGVDALAAYSEMLDIQQQAAGTSLEDEVDAVVEAMDGFTSGTYDSAAVVAAGGALLDVC